MAILQAPGDKRGVANEPFSQRELRTILRPGQTGTFQSRHTDEELAEIDAAMVRRREEAVAASVMLFPQPHEAARRVAEQWASTRAAIPDETEARAQLRQAHETRREAENEVARQREVFSRAQLHLAAMHDKLGGLEATEHAGAAAAAKGLVAALSRGDQHTPHGIDMRDRLEAARRRRDQAADAVELVAAELTAAESVLTQTTRDLGKAAEIVAADAWLRLSDEIDQCELALAAVVERRHATGVWLTSGGKIERTAAGGLVRQLAVDAEADLG
jgi:hypothetical protein